MKILILLSRVPYPLDKGDKLRAFHQIRILAQHHEIILCALNDQPLHPDALKVLRSFCKHVEIIPLSKAGILVNIIKTYFSGKPLQTGYFYNKKTHKKINDLIHEFQPDHIYCQLIRMAKYVKEEGNILKTIDYMDALSTGMERRIENSPWYLQPFLKMESKRLKKYEKEIFSWFTNKTIISEQDKILIDHPEYQKIVVIPNGVDTGFFEPMQLKKEYDLVFTGNMNYPPNINSAVFLAKKILPLVKNKYPGVKLLISGINPSSEVLALQSKNISVTGWIKDIRESYSKSKIFIAPMLIGTGLQNKLLEAMAMGLPCITSQLANNALGAMDGENILIGKNPEEYAKHIFQLLENEDLSQRIAQKGFEFINFHYRWEDSTGLLNQVITGK